MLFRSKPAVPLAPPQARNRALQASIGVVPGRADLFAVNLHVVSTQPENDPLRGTVEFLRKDKRWNKFGRNTRKRKPSAATRTVVA